MHIPDGLIWPPILAAGWVVAIAGIAMAVRRSKVGRSDRLVPTMSVLAAGIFVAQMLNFPIIGGTTGHLLGATIATFIVGPWSAIIVMSVVIIIQGLMFGDGGLLAMGLNLTNMAIVPVFLSAGAFRVMRSLRKEAAVTVAAWMAVVVAAGLCAVELSVSHAASPESYGIVWSLALPAMLGLHALIGIGEGLISSTVATYLLRVSPEIIQEPQYRTGVSVQ